MKPEKLINQLMPPCPKCPYTLGMIHAVKNPCPECKENGYQTYERFKRQASEEYMDIKLA